jgi:rod shape-determining protein MreB
VPSGLTKVERRAVEDATRAAGARSVALIEEPLAAAIGAGLPVSEPSASMILDIGGGTTEIAVIALGGMVVAHSLPVGGYELDDAIVRYVRQARDLLIGQETAERAKIAIGSARGALPAGDFEVRGRHALSGLLKGTGLTAAEAQEAVAQPVGRIVAAVVDTLERTPPELAADIAVAGIVLAGGGSLLRNLSELLAEVTQVPARIADDPLLCVAMGAGHALEELERMERPVWRGRGRLSAR